MTMLLVADSIGKSFNGGRVLTAASLRAEAGKIVALLGRNQNSFRCYVGVADTGVSTTSTTNT
jgi:ABC-type lipopolysaccharide export system ATPase subunit